MVREIASLSFFIFIHTLLLSAKVLRLRRSEPSLPEQIEFRPENKKLALCPSAPLIPFLLSGSRLGREIKVRMGLFRLRSICGME